MRSNTTRMPQTMRQLLHHTGRTVAVLFLFPLLVAVTGCDGNFGKEFRATAGPSLQSGLTTIVTGLIDGAFAVYDPGATGADNPSS